MIFGIQNFSFVMKKQLLLLFISLFSFLSNAQETTGKVRGFVLEKGTDIPVGFANTVLEGTNYGAVTNVDGYFQINNIEPGEYTLVISFVGFKTQKLTVNVRAGRIFTQKIYLEESSEILDDVEINVDRQERETKVLTGVVSLDPKEIEQFSVGGDADIVKALQVLPGVVTTGDQGGQLYIRGGAPIQNLILLDGMVVYNPFHSIGFYSVFDSDIIQSADVHSAGFGSQYGSRNSAVVDVKTRTPNRSRFAGKVSASTYTSKVLLETPLGKKHENGLSNGSFMLSAKTSYLDQSSDIFYPYVETEYDGLPFNFTDLYGKLSVNSPTGSNFNLYGFSFDDQVKFSGNSVMWNSLGAGANFRLVPSASSFLLEGNFNFSDYDITSSEINNIDRTSSISGFNGGLDFTYFLGDYNELTYGIEAIGYKTVFEIESLTGSTTDQTENTTELGAYITYRYTNDKLILEPGFRVHYYSSQGQLSPEPRLAAKYNVNDWFRIKLAGGLYSQNLMAGYSDRDVVNLFYGFLSGPGRSQLPDDFRGEEITSSLQLAQHAVVGTEFELSKYWTLNVEAYVKNFSQLTNLNRNKIYEDNQLNAGEPDILKSDYIVEKGVAKGLDFLLKYKTKQWYLWTAYSISKVTRDDGITEYYPNFDRRHNLNFVGTYMFGKDLSWELSARYNFGTGFPFTPTQLFYSKLPFTTSGSESIDYDYTTANGELGTLYGDLNSKRLPNYHRFDISAKKTIKINEYQKLEIAAGATNILNYQNIFYYDRTENKRVDQLPIMPTISFAYSF